MKQGRVLGKQFSHWKDTTGKQGATNLYRKVQDAGRQATEGVNPWASMRRLRRNIILGAFSGLFVYGVATNIPGSVAFYALEKSKGAQEKKAPENPWWKFW